MQTHSTMPAYSTLPQSRAERRAGAKPLYVCVHVCMESIKRLWFYCTVHRQSHSGDDRALVMLCQFAVGEDLLSITEG